MQTPASLDPLAFFVITSSGTVEDQIYPAAEAPVELHAREPETVHPHASRAALAQQQPALRLVG